MKRAVFLIAVLFVTANITGCSRPSVPMETKRERLAIFAENQKLRDQAKQYNREIRQLKEQIEQCNRGTQQRDKDIEQQQGQIAQLTQQVADLENQLGETISQGIDAIGIEVLEENVRLQQRIEELETQLKQCKE
jgi:peptidoglycan hydrolase CwlO-like protein